MVTREELKALIDQLPEPEIEMVRQMLEQLIHPPPPSRPEVERMRQRSRAYKNLVEQRFQETHRPATIGGMGGSGGGIGGSGLFGEHEGTPFGRNEFHYWDDKALVHQSLANFDGQAIELMERLSLSPDRTKLHCSLEISSGGRTVNYTEEFPITNAEAHP
jgi:hypothetical protein